MESFTALKKFLAIFPPFGNAFSPLEKNPLPGFAVFHPEPIARPSPFHCFGNYKIPPRPPFFKGANGGMSADASLKKAMERKVVAFLKKLKSH
jgi:hypothetical protein